MLLVSRSRHRLIMFVSRRVFLMHTRCFWLPTSGDSGDMGTESELTLFYNGIVVPGVVPTVSPPLASMGPSSSVRLSAMTRSL